MGYIQNFIQSITGKPRILHTSHGDFNLAKASGRKNVQKIVAQLQRTTEALTRSDMQDWRNAWQMAISVESPNRQRLYDIYRDADVDAHLSGCVEQRKGFVMARSFKIIDKNENVRMMRCTISTRHGLSNFCALPWIPSIGVTRSLSLATLPLMVTVVHASMV